MLYSINEQNATVALQNVLSYGTEGRELTDAETTLVAPTDAVHPYLSFRGQDIKDLHVHENQAADEAKTEIPVAEPTKDPRLLAKNVAAPAPPTATDAAPTQSQSAAPKSPAQQQQAQVGRGVGGNRRPRKPNAAVGTGASLLTRKERGVVADTAASETKADFDFQSHNDQFARETAEDDEAGDEPVTEVGIGTYEKSDFFDSISCDALDKQSGVDNRLRGQHERQLNTETFGAIALNNSRRRGRGGDRGGGRGWGGRGRGRGRGRGGGRNASTRNSSAAGAQQSRYTSDS